MFVIDWDVAAKHIQCSKTRRIYDLLKQCLFSFISLAARPKARLIALYDSPVVAFLIISLRPGFLFVHSAWIWASARKSTIWHCALITKRPPRRRITITILR